MKLASKGEVLCFLHTSANVRGMFKSTTGKMTTDSGHRQRAVARTHPTPMPVDTRLRMVGSLTPLLNDMGGLQTAAITFKHHAVVEFRVRPPRKPDKWGIR